MSDSETRTSSYKASEMPLGFDKELERLRSQALITWDKEARHLQWWGLRDDMAVLELGSGPGFVTEQLLQLVPNGSVTCVEIDTELIGKARNYLQSRELDRWQIIEGNVMSTGLPDNSFDLVYGRYLFQHLPDPVGAAREALRVLKPGGMLVITDVDDKINVFEPDLSGRSKELSDRIEKAFQDEQAGKGGDRFVGRRLPGILSKAGFELAGYDALVLHSDLTDMSGLMPPPTRESMQYLVDMGLMTEDDVDFTIKDSAEWEANEHIIVVFLMMGCGRKPQE